MHSYFIYVIQRVDRADYLCGMCEILSLNATGRIIVNAVILIGIFDESPQISPIRPPVLRRERNRKKYGKQNKEKESTHKLKYIY